jgi:hypothetical protein
MQESIAYNIYICICWYSRVIYSRLCLSSLHKSSDEKKRNGLVSWLLFFCLCFSFTFSLAGYAGPYLFGQLGRGRASWQWRIPDPHERIASPLTKDDWGMTTTESRGICTEGSVLKQIGQTLQSALEYTQIPCTMKSHCQDEITTGRWSNILFVKSK